jgi:ABC-type transport system involved in cytochrome bd biosynthesis fused ATPase/permease subunit
MEGPVQPDRALRALQVVLAACDALGRLALPTAVLGLASGASDGALVAALVASGAGLIRGAVASRAARRALIAAWTQTIAAARGRPVEALPRRREHSESVAVLMEGIHEQAMFSAVFVPHLAGVAISAVGIAAASVAILGVLSSLAGAALLALLGVLTLGLGRGLRKAQIDSWTSFGLLASEMRVLIEGALELRATGREAYVATRVGHLASEVARHESRATAVSTRMGILPASLAILAVATPLRAGLGYVEAALAGKGLFQASVIGAAAVATAIAAGRVWEQWTSTEPRRARFRSFVAAYPPTESSSPEAAPSRSLAELPIAFVPQDPLLIPGESLAWHCRLHAAEPPTDAEVDACLERVGLAAGLASRARARGVSARDLPAGELSGGERRRLALARALARPRELYVLDEPEAGLDGSARADLVATITDLAREARVLLVAHDPDVIPASFHVVQMGCGPGASPARPRLGSPAS